MYTQLGVLTKGTIVEVNVSELGIVTVSNLRCLSFPSVFFHLDQLVLEGAMLTPNSI